MGPPSVIYKLFRLAPDFYNKLPQSHLPQYFSSMVIRLNSACTKPTGSICLFFQLIMAVGLVASFYSIYNYQVGQHKVMLSVRRHEPVLSTVTKKRSSIDLQLANSRLKKDFELGRTLLSDIIYLRNVNNHVLPQKSHFTAVRQNKTLLCEGNDESCVGKFGRGIPDFYMVSPKYKIVGCLIQKNMSTLLQALLCYFLDERKIRVICDSGVSLSFLGYTIGSGLCESANLHATIKNALSSLRLPSESKGGLAEASVKLLAIVRDPVDRFLSGFLDKCIRHPIEMHNHTTPNLFPCNGCGANLTCFVMSEYQRMKKVENTAESLPDEEVGKAGSTNEDFHFFPQNWRCDFKKLLPSYTLLRYTSLQRRRGESDLMVQQSLPAKLVKLLEKIGVDDESLSFIRSELETKATTHLTSDSEARKFFEHRLRRSPFLMEFIIRMFYWDFKLFEYDIPSLG